MTALLQGIFMPIRPNFAEKSTIIQRHKLKLDKSYFTQPTVIWVLRGRKILRWINGEKIIQAGEMVMLAGNQRFDVINEPDELGVYQADWLIMQWLRDFLGCFRSQNPLKACFTCLHILLYSKLFRLFQKHFPVMKFLIVLWKFACGNC